MDRLLVPAVLWIAFLDTSRAALSCWTSAGLEAAKHSGGAPIHACICLSLWLCALAWLIALIPRIVPQRALRAKPSPPPLVK